MSVYQNLIARLFKSKSILEVLRPALLLACPFKFNVEKGSTKTLFSFPFLLLSGLLHAIYFTSAAIVIINQDSNLVSSKRSGLNVFREQVEICTGLAAVLFLLLDTFVNKRDLAKAFDNLFEVDVIFESIGRKRRYDHLRFRVTVLVVLFYSLHILSNHLGEFLRAENYDYSFKPLVLVMHFPIYLIGVIITIFSAFVYMISLDLLILNREFEKISLAKEPIIINHYYATADIIGTMKKSSGSKNFFIKSMVPEKISVLWQAYTKICHTSLLVNHYFSRKIMVAIALSFLSALFNLFFFLTELIHVLRHNVTDVPFLIYFSSRCVVHVVNLITVISSCEACEDLVSQRASVLLNFKIVNFVPSTDTNIMYFGIVVLGQENCSYHKQHDGERERYFVIG